MYQRNRESRDGRSEREAYGRGTSRDTSGRLFDFFVDGYRMDFQVLQNEIRKYLGPEATARPSTYNGKRGYLVTAVRPFTEAMLDNLRDLSDAYNAEAMEFGRRGYQGGSHTKPCEMNDAELSRAKSRSYSHDVGNYVPPYYNTNNQSIGYPSNSKSASSASNNRVPSQDPEGHADINEPYRPGSGYALASYYPSAYQSAEIDKPPQFDQSRHGPTSYDSRYSYPDGPIRGERRRETRDHDSNDQPSSYNSASEPSGSILCHSCQEQAKRSSRITLCGACRAKIVPIIESCGSSKDDAIKMLTNRLYEGGLLAGGGLIAAHIINCLCKFRPT